MFYEIGDEVVGIEKEEISQSFLTAGYLTAKELEDAAALFGFSRQTVLQCRKDTCFRANLETYDDYYFATLKLMHPKNGAEAFDKTAVFVRKNLFLAVDIDGSGCVVRDAFLNALHRFAPQNLGIEKLVCAFLSSALEGDGKFLEDTEAAITAMEKAVIAGEASEDFNFSLLETKQHLLLLRSYYEQLIDLCEALEENENELFDERETRHFRILIDKIQRLKDNVDRLRDTAVHLKEAYESSLELALNKTMKIFTVFTVIFSPLSLIAGWYGMNFNTMAEFRWRYGYLFVICLSLLTAAVILFVFKRKKWI